MRTFSRRRVFGLAVAATAAPSLTYAFNDEEEDPAELVRRRFSVKRFLALSKEDIYKVNLAVRRGRQILIEGYSPSESKEIIQLAVKNPEAARARLAK